MAAAWLPRALLLLCYWALGATALRREAPAAAAKSPQLSSKEWMETEKYRETKSQQYIDYVRSGAVPQPLPGEARLKELWERRVAEVDSTLDRKVAQFLNDQAVLTGAFYLSTQVFDPQNKKKPESNRHEQHPVPQSNGSRWVEVYGNNFRTMKFYHMHIPRTAGTSFKQDAHATVVNNLTLSMFSREGCYSWKTKFPYVDAVVTMVRNPRSHVLSQFLYCSEGSIHLLTQVHKFRPWIEEWTRLTKLGKLVGDFGQRSQSNKQLRFQKFVTHSFLPFHCYSPVNLMVQHFTCKSSPFNYTNESSDVKTQKAIQNMQETFFVGITEAYQESLCVFHVKVHNRLPKFCDCNNRTAWHSFNTSHTGYYFQPVSKDSHSVSKWRQETKDLVDNLTRSDWKLYQAALDRFARELHEAERRFNTTIMCEDKLSRQSRHEDPAQRDFSFYMRQARASLKARPS